MVMKKRKARVISMEPQYSELWRLHQNVGRMAAYLGREKDSATVRRQQVITAPLSLLPMVF